MKINPQLGMLAFGITLAAGVIYLANTFLDKFKEKADDFGKGVADLVPQGIIDTVADVGTKAVVRDGFVLPGGRTVTFTQLIESGGKVSGDQTLVWQGVKYRLTMRNPDGWYLAERA